MAKDDVTLALALQKIEELEKLHEENAQEIRSLKSWKETCSKWAAWWAGVCAAVMALATLVRTYWNEIGSWFRTHP